MTTTSDGASAPVPERRPELPPGPVLVRGELHPAVLVLRLLQAGRQSLFPLLLGAVVNRWFLVLAAFVFLVELGHGLVLWSTTRYALTGDELILRSGVLQRQERRIPIDRVQDLGFESSLLRRLFDICVVRVETASGQGAEATLDSLGRAEAERLREALLQQRGRRAADAGLPAPSLPSWPSAPAVEPEWTVFVTRWSDLVWRGLTDLRLGAVVVTALAALQLADHLGAVLALRGVAQSFFALLGRFPPAVAALALAALVAVVLLGGLVASAVGNLALFFGFRLSLRGDVLVRRYGLFTTRSKSLPRRRVQRVTVEQTWLRRLLGRAVVKADSAGSNRGEGEDQAGGWDVVVPLASQPAAMALLPAVLPGLERARLQWRPASRRLVLRAGLAGSLFALLATVPAVVAWGAPGLVGLLAAPMAWLLGWLAWQSTGWACADGVLGLRWGLLGRHCAFVPLRRVQAVVVRAGPLQRLLGLCEVTVLVAGGSPTRVPELIRADAEALQAALVALAAAAAAQDWRPRAGVS